MPREPVPPPSKPLQAAEHLRTLILSGELGAGMPLRQTALARRFGMSTIPLREALRLLEQEGLVTTRPNCGASVAPLDPDEVLHLTRIRVALETEALELTLPFHTPATLAEAREALQALRRPTHETWAAQRHAHFYRCLFGPGTPPALLAEIQRMLTMSQRYLALGHLIALHLPPEIPRLSDVLDSLATQDLAQAQGRLRLLYLHTAILTSALLRQRELEARPPARRRRGRPARDNT